MRAMVSDGARSTMGRISTPPSASASTPRLAHGPARCEGGRQVETAEQAIVGDGNGRAAHGRVGRKQIKQRAQEVFAGRSGGAAHQDAAEPCGIDREQGCGARQVHSPNRLASARWTRTPESTSSSTLRRSRWRSANGATRRRCLSATALSPSSAAAARARADQREFAAQAVGADGHADLHGALERRGRRVDVAHALARGRDLAPDLLVLAAPLLHEGAGSRSKASRRRTTSMREGTSCGVFTSRLRPKRSSNCGRNSPSSGLPLPTSTKRAGWRTLRPSRSTTFSPEAVTSSSRSTR